MELLKSREASLRSGIVLFNNAIITQVEVRTQDLAGEGGQELFFSDLGICM